MALWEAKEIVSEQRITIFLYKKKQTKHTLCKLYKVDDYSDKTVHAKVIDTVILFLLVLLNLED